MPFKFPRGPVSRKDLELGGFMVVKIPSVTDLLSCFKNAEFFVKGNSSLNKASEIVEQGRKKRKGNGNPVSEKNS